MNRYKLYLFIIYNYYLLFIYLWDIGGYEPRKTLFLFFLDRYTSYRKQYLNSLQVKLNSLHLFKIWIFRTNIY